MSIRTYFVYTEVEFTEFSLLLTEHQIPFESRLLSNTHYVSLNMVNSYAEFLIDDLYALQVQEILEELGQKTEEISDSLKTGQERLIAKNHDKPKRKIRWGIIILTLYALIVTIWLLKSKREMNALINPETKYDWNWNSTILTETMSDKPFIKTIFFNENSNGKWELMQHFVDGKLIGSYYDENDNGYVERSVHYDINKKIVATWLDNDENEIWEYGFYITNDLDTLFIQDTNQDGLVTFELKQKN